MTTIDLSGDWRLIRTATKESFPARVPGDTHSALIASGKITDPYLGMNELDAQWVGREDWAYEREFDVGGDFLSEEKVWLSCDSLDTVAEVFLNGKKAGNADTMFVRLLFDAKPFLKAGRNSIRIAFTSAEKTAEAQAKKLPYPIPHTAYPIQSPHRNLVRKVQCHSGWDWGPCLMVAGIYGDISLRATSGARIDYVYTEQSHSKGRCRVRVFVECDAPAGEYELAAALGGHTVSKKVKLAGGYNRPSVDIVVNEPRLWWPNGYGEQPLYDLAVSLGGDMASKKLGLRKLELITREDKIGLSMGFRVNGVDIFCKGANWIPSDALPQRETPKRLERLVSSAAEANMNMLRVWGGGRYESEEFYCLCDRMGILVWQDMMFSCALYPSSASFLRSVEREIRHQVKRLRDHPCIALWCGNNENLGALTWFPESKKNRDRYVVDYDRLYEGTIGKTVDECDPTRSYWPSSPSGGRGDFSDNWHGDTRGDMHYWRVWHEGASFDSYSEVTPRFCSEFGYQSFPSMETIRTFAAEPDFNVTSPVMEHHQRSPDGNSRITEMFTRYFRMPEGFESFVYLSQVQQAWAVKTAVERWRRSRPVCMGTLYWQLNDNWPVCSWSSIEYSGTWKLLHYVAKRFFAPVLLAAELIGDRVEVWLTNDLRENVDCRVTIAVLDFKGARLSQESIDARARAGSARLIKTYRLADLAPSPERAFLRLTLSHDGAGAVNELFLTEPKRCALARANVTAEVGEAREGFIVHLGTDAPAFHVSLTASGIPGDFDDNCFTLVPGEPREVPFTPLRKTSGEEFRKVFGVHHLRETYR